MPSDYESIYAENEKRYGTDIGRIGTMLLADRYDDRTHFIFELLQNSEDARARQTAAEKPRTVDFRFDNEKFVVSHFGESFNKADVLGVCGIAESTKTLSAIGRFGIGFKSVYTFTDRPEIHSGNEDFAIEKFVLPVKVERTFRNNDQTVIVLPLKKNDTTAISEISNGLKQIGLSSLLFLRHIEEITWKLPDGTSGVYLRSKPESLGSHVQRINVIGQKTNELDVDQNWLVFDREVSMITDAGLKTGRVEIAFYIIPDKNRNECWSIQPVVESPLVVYFPTVLPTNLGFLVQGPYRTTPSRDNVPRGDTWNQYLVEETAELLVESLLWLRDSDMLDMSTLLCLPLNKAKFGVSSMFAPLFDILREALKSEKLLPRFENGYVAASQAKLARTKELRELFNSEQIGSLYGSEDLAWLSSEITQDRSPELRQYVMQELSIAEITPENIVPKLDKDFLEAQPDEWVVRLYIFLSGQTALRRKLDAIPLIRLTDGSHVVAKANGQPQAFLPSALKTDFPTMRQEVCMTQEIKDFLVSLGITEPDPVDDVIWNLLPKYKAEEIEVTDQVYAEDIGKIRSAYYIDSKIQQEKLLSALRVTPFVMAVDMGDNTKWVAKPDQLYRATERLKGLFDGVHDIMLVDDSYLCLRGDNLSVLLEACGAVRYLKPIETSKSLPYSQHEHDSYRELRKQAGHPETSGRNDNTQDYELLGLENLTEILPTLDRENRIKRATLIWECLNELEERRGRSIFEGLYTWTHNGSYKANFPSAFVQHLNSVVWIPDEKGDLQKPECVLFDTLGWKANPFLQTKVNFKSPLIDQLAKAAGIDPAILQLLKTCGITSEDELKARLGINEQPIKPDINNVVPNESSVYDDANDLWGDSPDAPPDATLSNGGEETRTNNPVGDSNGRPGNGGNANNGSGSGHDTPDSGNSGQQSRIGGSPPNKRSPGGDGGRPFISYIGTHPEEDAPESDGLDQATRMRIEDLAIQEILRIEPKLSRTPTGNSGYDLIEKGSDGLPIRWVEVKAMSGSLSNRPVGLSKAQFEWAYKHGLAFWLYIVEHASEPEAINILRIQNPAGHARTFTFDHGWASIATLPASLITPFQSTESINKP